MLGRLIVAALGAVAALGLLLAVYDRLGGLYAEQAAGADVRPPERAEDRQLFLELMEAGLIVPRADGGLELPASDMLLRLESEGALPPPETLSRQRRLLHALYRSALGRLVIQQVELWNDSRRMAAVRDDRARRAEAEPVPTEELWSAFNPDRHPLRPARIVPESFGFVHAGDLRGGFGEWLAVAREDGAVTFRGPGAAGLEIQLIGEPMEVPDGASVSMHAPPERGEPAVIIPEGVSAKADASEGIEDGVTPSEPCRPVGATVTLPAEAERGTVELTVRPSPSCASAIAGLAIHRTVDGGYDWRPLRRGRPPKEFIVWSRDWVPLTGLDGSGEATDEAFALGLMPVVGFGPGATFSLSGLLASSDLAEAETDVRLTLDSTYQSLAQDAVAWGVERFGDDAYAAERKASVVMLDADTGAILASASHPAVEPGGTAWDYAAFGRSYPLRDPSSVLGWQTIDRHNTPGSTFKPLVGLSLMRADEDKLAELRPILEGLDPGALQRATGLSPGQGAYAPSGGNRSIANFGGAPIGRYFDRPNRSSACAEEVPSDPLFGLHEAVQFSINVWFARMSVMLDRDVVADYAKRLVDTPALIPVRPPNTGVLDTARAIGLDDREHMDLAWNLPAAGRLARRQDDVGADVLYAQLPKNALREINLPRYNAAGVENLLAWVIALNGIGQSVSVSPLHMATVASVIATGQRVRPHVIAAWNERLVDVPPAEPLDVDPALLDLLRAGMKAVPEVGTAPAAFRDKGDLACRTYGKTGTAEIDKAKSFNTAWFIGWREPRDPDAFGARRVAFACMMTHAHGPLRTGGGACAPVIARILAELEPPEPEGGE